MDQIMDELKNGIDVDKFVNEMERGEFEFVYNDMLDNYGPEHIRMWVFDEFDRQFMFYNGQIFYDNLIKYGCKCDLENDTFVINDKQYTSYGIVWDYWYDLDTCIRETVSDTFLENILPVE
jgi:hypothetical protein